MDKLVIQGGYPFSGSVQIAGAKNAALPILAASLLGGTQVSLANVPHVSDVDSMLNLLGGLGADVGPLRNGRLSLSTGNVSSSETTYDIVRRMRASFLVLAPLVGRFGHARISRPGGCAIGTRPVDLHLEALQQLGAEVQTESGVIDVTARGGLKGARIVFPTPTVGATHTALMAAVSATGESEIVNCAREPEIADTAAFLSAMGATIEGAGTHRMLVQGPASWRPASHTILPDRIEAASYLVAAGLTGGRLEVIGGRLEHLGAACHLLEAAGLSIFPTDRGLIAERRGTLHSVDMATEAFPGFPTDLQAQFMTLMCLADGVSVIRERIFEQRFMHVPELQRMGADISLSGAAATVRGVSRLQGAEVMATDLRASMSLVLAGLVAEGETVVHRVYHLDRGYEDIDGKLTRCGAQIARVAQ
ncbi:UDP-N-acetylglucosamine 1-carboxyvinyltransferase [Stappia sp. ES.058]|uniref:UDP-N-acetylglucosamine 1-carboxyvinyltransferase n=1 Tax=Stappia sp. ES.058 TaxID=1881061 RepID=UPI00087C8D8D|nr:UDP-N-acetylglucosamine 1-carboxyvinyltransferase [Stappia sp. ES.058]SDU45852.1 UDP-N-acetylglucosamine 1-carboxyvinyltransferase [Stappia sp. ES.058]